MEHIISFTTMRTVWLLNTIEKTFLRVPINEDPRSHPSDNWQYTREWMPYNHFEFSDPGSDGWIRVMGHHSETRSPVRTQIPPAEVAKLDLDQLRTALGGEDASSSV